MSGATTISNPGGALTRTAQGSQIIDEFVAGGTIASGHEVNLEDATTGTTVTNGGTGSAVGLAVEDAVTGDLVRVCRSGHVRFFNNTGGALSGGVGVAKFAGTINDQTEGEAWVTGAM